MPLHERKLIARIEEQARAARAPQLAAGIGDDCAVLRAPGGHELLVTTDFSIEDTHFRRALHPPESVGHRCLARGLSDIAAMGGKPLASFLSLALPPQVRQAWVDSFLQGLLRLAKRYGAPLAGGDISSTRGLIVADIVVVGSAPRGRALRRSGARVGDAIYVTGALGGSAASLRRIIRGEKLKARSHPEHFFPTPRLEVGRILRERKLAHAAIDLSDGLSTDLSHICEQSRVGAVLYADAIPVARNSTIELALHGGEDYELLFTASAGVPEKLAGVPVTRIGEIVREDGLWIFDRAGRRKSLAPRGWEHFRK